MTPYLQRNAAIVALDEFPSSSDVPGAPLMKFTTLILLGLLIYGIFTTHTTVRRSRSAQEKAAAWRVSVFAWILGFTLLGAFLFLPNKHRVLMLAPMLLGAVIIVKIWQSTRARIRREQEEIVDLERMKRVN